MDQDPAPNPTENRENINFCFIFFSIKNIFLPNMICFVIYGVIFMSVNISLIVLKIMYDILMILVDFGGHFPWFLVIFCYPDPESFHWSGSGSELKRIRIRNTACLYSELSRGSCELIHGVIVRCRICGKVRARLIRLSSLIGHFYSGAMHIIFSPDDRWRDGGGGGDEM